MSAPSLSRLSVSIAELSSFEAAGATAASAICDSIVRAGVGTVFIIQGDYNIALLKAIQAHDALDFVHPASDAELGLLAEGYSRVHPERLGVCSFTHNTGSLLALAGVAGAEAERQGVVAIGGCPNAQAYAQGLLQHHTYQNHETSQTLNAYGATCASAVHVRTASEAAPAVGRALRLAADDRHAAFVEVPVNLWEQPTPLAVLPLTKNLGTLNEEGGVMGWINAIAQALADAHQPLIVVGRDVETFGCKAPVEAIAKQLDCEVLTTMCGKTAFPNDSPQWVGTYWGDASTEAALEALQRCDRCLVLGMLPFDYGSAGFTAGFPDEKRIRLDARGASAPGDSAKIAPIGGDTFRAMVKRLSESIPGVHRSARSRQPRPRPIQAGSSIVLAPDPQRAPDAGLTFAQLSSTVAESIRGGKDVEHYFFETGTSWWLARDAKFPATSQAHVQILFGMLGWSLHAATGAAVALKERKQKGRPSRAIAFIGDGAFQVLCSGISTAVKHKLPITYVVLNNGLYGVENGIAESDLNELKQWDYPSVAKAFGGTGGEGIGTRSVKTTNELKGALEEARVHNNDGKGPYVLDVHICREHYAPASLEAWARGVIRTNGTPPPTTVNPFDNVWSF